MKLFLLPSLILLGAMTLSGCQQDVQEINEQYQLFAYQNQAANSYIYTSRNGYRNLVEVAEIAPHSKYYIPIQAAISYSIQNQKPVCLRYRSSSALTIIGLCNPKVLVPS